MNNKKGGKVHPTPPPPVSDHHLSLLPAALFALTVVLTAQDKEVLAYLLSHNKKTTHNYSNTKSEHPPLFNCTCFGCYTSYWSRWDASPNRQLIHDIIWEDEHNQNKQGEEKKSKNKNKKSKSRNRKQVGGVGGGGGGGGSSSSSTSSGPGGNIGGKMGLEVEKKAELAVVEAEKGVVRKFASLIGGAFWGAWD